MILPDKHVPPSDSLLGVGAVVLGRLGEPKSVTALWEVIKADPHVATFERFTLTLDLLYLLGAIDMRDGQLAKRPT